MSTIGELGAFLAREQAAATPVPPPKVPSTTPSAEPSATGTGFNTDYNEAPATRP